MCSWNIAGAREKLNDKDIDMHLRQFDVVWILETKMIKTTKISGFIPYYKPSIHGEHCGGILLLDKSFLENTS